MGLNGNNVGEEVLSRQCQVLNHEIQSVVSVLDAGDGYISDSVDESRQDNATNVTPHLALEGQLAFTITRVDEDEVLGEFGHSVSQPFVARILADSPNELGNAVDEAIEMGLVLSPISCDRTRRRDRCGSGAGGEWGARSDWGGSARNDMLLSRVKRRTLSG